MNLLVGCLQDAKALGYRQLAVSGGEPLLYSELDALLANARDLGMLTTLTSNGMLDLSKLTTGISMFPVSLR